MNLTGIPSLIATVIKSFMSRLALPKSFPINWFRTIIASLIFGIPYLWNLPECFSSSLTTRVQHVIFRPFPEHPFPRKRFYQHAVSPPVN